MALDDPARRALYARLTEVLGDDHAATLMGALPVPGLELVSTADLEAMEERLLARLGSQLDGLGTTLGSRIDRFEERMDRFVERMDRFEGRMDRFEGHLEKFDDRLHQFHFALNAQVRQLVIAQAGVLLSLAIVAFAAARLT